MSINCWWLFHTYLVQPLCLHAVDRETERERNSGNVLKLQPSECLEPLPFYPPLSLLHKNISDVREVMRLRVKAHRAEKKMKTQRL